MTTPDTPEVIPEVFDEYLEWTKEEEEEFVLLLETPPNKESNS